VSEQLLHASGVTIAYGGVPVVHDVTLTLHAGERVGLVGETGSGKSTLAMSLLGMLARGGEVVAGSIAFAGRELIDLRERDWCRIRGRELAVVFQDAGAALDPVKSIGWQVAEAIRVHERDASRAHLRLRVAAALEQVGIPAARAGAYPHELSGGQRQRVAIATALVHRPRLVIADEPTSALDVTTQAQTLRLLDDLVADVGAALLMVSHDLGVVSQFCETTVVMYAGRIVEAGPSPELFAQPRHAYTSGLLRSVAALSDPDCRRLPTIGEDVLAAATADREAR